MNNSLFHIEAFDCLPFDSQSFSGEIFHAFIQSQSSNIFSLSSKYYAEDESKLAEYDYRNKCWTAGRFVGEAIFKYQSQDYKVTIKPRFGENVLFKMLEEIFNVRITKSASEQSQSKDWQHYIKRIISFIWLQKLANANLHGLPKIQRNNVNQGTMFRGRLDVRKSIRPYYITSEVVTTYWDKQIDFVIAQIIYQALQILKSDFEIGKINVPDSAQEAINHISNEVREKEFIGEHEYKTIRYKEIYMSWKPVVDLSWDIIKRKQLSLKQKQAHQGLGFFIDMAEVWEQYLRAILKKALSPYGWSYRSEEQMAYKGLFFQRRLIPDLVFQKGDYVAVWDAKYKRMLGRPFDVDRSDFFQIHTYIQNFMFPHRVKAGGLLYPISILGADFKKYSSPNLISERGANVNFAIDGIELNENHGETDMRISKEEFIGRIVSRLS